MTPQARTGVPFELLRFTAAPVTGALVVLELEGRFRQSTRFGRPPVLVVEPGPDERRLELAPIRARADGHRWQASYAAPAEAMSAGVRLALGVRGTLLELPAPDEPDDGARLTALAREANTLRRRLEAVEADAAAARAQAAAATERLETAVQAARDAALAESGERIDALEHEVVEAHRVAGADAAAARAEHERAIAAARAEGEAAVAAARAEAATEREQADADAGARVQAAEREAEQAASRAAAAEHELQVAREGIEVLRAELAEERERSPTAPGDDAETRVPVSGGDLETTRPFSVAEQRDADDDATQPQAPADVAARRRPRVEPRLVGVVPAEIQEHGAASHRHGPNLSRWVAVAALLLFAFVLLGLLLGFLP